MKTLAYYSRTGNTKKVAEALAENLNADVEAITADTKDKGMGRLAKQAFLRVHAKIAQTMHDAAFYDVVVVGSPVTGRMSSRYERTLRKTKIGLSVSPSFARMKTQAARAAQRCWKAWKRLPEKSRGGMLDVPANNVESGAYAEKVERFAAALLELPSSQ